MDARPSASWPTAVLIAVTSPGTSGVGGVTTKRKLRSAGVAARLEGDAGLGLQDEVAGGVLVEPLDVQLRSSRPATPTRRRSR